MTLRTIFLSVPIFLSLQAYGSYCVTVSASENFTPFVAESTSDQVNVRAGQSANFEQLCQLKKGEEVVVVGKEYSWYKIQLPPSAKSFVSKDYVQFLGLNAGGVIAADVNIRAGAGIHHTVLGQMSKGEQIYIQDDLDGWYRIEPVAESFGWVSEKFLKLKSNDLSSHPKTPPRKFINKEEAQQEPVLGERQMVEDTPADDLPAAMNKGVVSFTGTVESYEDAGADGIYYKIVAGGQIVCYIQGVNHMLGRFVHQQVSIDGTANSKLRPQYPYPVIAVLKVRLIL